MSKLTKEQIAEFKEEESQAKDAQDYIILAESISKTLDDNDWAKKLLEEAEKLAIDEDNPLDRYIDIAELAADNESLGNKDYAKEIYKKLEEYSEKTKLLKRINTSKSFWLTILGESIAKDNSLGDKVWAKELYQKAVELQIVEGSGAPSDPGAEYQDIVDWNGLAESISKSLGDNDWAKELFQKSIDLAEDTVDYCSIAESIMNSIGNIDYTTKVLQIAEQKSKDFNDYIILAENAAKFISYESAINYYQLAISTAEQFLKKGLDYQEWEFTEDSYFNYISNMFSSINAYIYSDNEDYLGKLKDNDSSLAKSLVNSMYGKLESILETKSDIVSTSNKNHAIQNISIGAFLNRDLIQKIVESSVPIEDKSDAKELREFISASNLSNEDKKRIIELSLLKTKEK